MTTGDGYGKIGYWDPEMFYEIRSTGLTLAELLRRWVRFLDEGDAAFHDLDPYAFDSEPWDRP